MESQYVKKLPEISACNEDLRKVLHKNPTIVKELHKLVEQGLADKLEKLGIKPDAQGISEEQLTRIQYTIDFDREEKAKGLPNFYLYRESLARKIQDRISGKDSICQLKTKVKKGTGKLNTIITQPSCAKICKNVKAPSPTPSSTSLSTISSIAGEPVEIQSSRSASTESSKIELSDTCELEEVCTLPEEKTTIQDIEGITVNIEEELHRRVMARAAKTLIPRKKNVAEVLK
ncbi:cilium assembly protein DZIP1-like [Leucoraja erinacea]|uniref:cilium assembly protein DZIP1-like n=1 Tax=Leucoraja erinaceus TaxID=7782 RepID=UPI00245841EE|nr:cilium assembly protein DZIP1-like [Leucoraja erinacea]